MAHLQSSTPRTLAETRAELEQAIEDAIAALDAHDGDPDLEPEPLDNDGGFM